MDGTPELRSDQGPSSATTPSATLTAISMDYLTCGFRSTTSAETNGIPLTASVRVDAEPASGIRVRDAVQIITAAGPASSPSPIPTSTGSIQISFRCIRPRPCGWLRM